ncbi:MAG TPA: hypothetical protein VLV45_10820 [Gemmatimonadales bacterium]|nr:hypothetical protein [Gemmatimonadales bacterium]
MRSGNGKSIALSSGWARVAAVMLILGFLPVRQSQAQWQTEHTVLAVASSATIATDWLLSANAIRRGTFDEMNPMLGHHPSVGQLNSYNVLVLGANLGIGAVLPNKWRTLWFTAVTSFETAIVLHQYNIGLHIDLMQM